MIIIYTDRYKKAKSIQPDNRKWAIIIKCINISDWYISFFIIIKSVYHLSNWTTDSDFSDDWIIKSIINKWINNKIGLK